MFEEELDFFIKNQAELVRKHQGQTLLLKGSKVIDVCDSPLAALVAAQREHGLKLGTFMIQRCNPGPDAYTITLSPCE